MGRRSKIDMFDLADRVLELYTREKLTIKEISERLQSEGYKVSRESVRKSIKTAKSLAKELTKSIDEARVMMDAVRSNPNTDISEAIITRLGGLLMRETQALDELSFDDPGEVVLAAGRLAQAQVRLGKLRLQYQSGFEAAKKAVLEALKFELAAEPELSQRLAMLVGGIEFGGRVNRPILDELVGDPGERRKAAERTARRNSCENDFFRFCRTYLPHYFGAEPALYHRVIMDVTSTGCLGLDQVETLKPLIKEKYHLYMSPTDRIAGIIDVEPRGFSKSTRYSLAFPLWLVLYRKRRFPIIFGASQDTANEALQSIKDEIEQNELIAEDFGDQKGKIWKANKIVLINGLAIAARGAGTSTRGIKNGPDRPDIAICDDIMTDELAASKKGRDKRYRWFKRVVLPLGKDLFPVLINTIFHEDDIVCRLLKELTDGQLKNWVGFRFAARTPSGDSLWPSYWTEEKLRKKEDELGSAAWSTEMMNEPLSSEDAIIKKFHYYELKDISFTGKRRFGGIDPATGVHDKCAFDTLVDGDDGVLYVADTWGERLDEAAFLDRIITTFLLWKHLSIGFEDVAFQGIYKNNLVEKAAANQVWLPISGRKTGGLSKVQRVKKMAPLIEAGFIRFRADQKELVEQLSMFTPDGPKSAYDDEADALWYAFEEAQDGRGQGVPTVVPFDQLTTRRKIATILRGWKR